jgi:hypothetical protein
MSDKPVAWSACLDCGQMVTSDSIHTCSPQLKELTNEEIGWFAKAYTDPKGKLNTNEFAKAILRKAQE